MGAGFYGAGLQVHTDADLGWYNAHGPRDLAAASVQHLVQMVDYRRFGQGGDRYAEQFCQGIEAVVAGQRAPLFPRGDGRDADAQMFRQFLLRHPLFLADLAQSAAKMFGVAFGGTGAFVLNGERGEGLCHDAANIWATGRCGRGSGVGHRCNYAGRGRGDPSPIDTRHGGSAGHRMRGISCSVAGACRNFCKAGTGACRMKRISRSTELSLQPWLRGQSCGARRQAATFSGLFGAPLYAIGAAPPDPSPRDIR